MEIVRKLLSADEISPPGTRYDPDCDCFQTTFDDGATWVDNPAADPRSAPQYQAPPPVTDDPRCDGAARMTALLKDSNDASIHAVSVVQAYSALFAVIALIFSLGVGLLVSLLIALADLIFSVGTTVVDDAFTEEVYDQIECITYCYLNDDGQFDDAAAWDAYQEEIGATFGLSVVTTVLARMFLSFGFVTMNNAASLRTETGDCSECDDCGCPSYYDNFVGGELGEKTVLSCPWQDYAGGSMTFFDGEYALQAHQFDPPHDESYGVAVYVDLGQDCPIGSVACDVWREGGGNPLYFDVYDDHGTLMYSSGALGGSAGWNAEQEFPGVNGRWICFTAVTAHDGQGYINTLQVVTH